MSPKSPLPRRIPLLTRLNGFPSSSPRWVNFSSLPSASRRSRFPEPWLIVVQGKNFDPEYLKINPNGTVPTLIVDGKTFTDSTVSLPNPVMP